MRKQDFIISIVGIVIVFLILNIITSQKGYSKTPTTSPTTSPTTNEAQLKIEDLQTGSGQEVKSGDTVTVNYTGTLEDDTKFDSSLDRNEPFTTQIGVGAVIKGWDQGIVGMKVGGKRRLIIPPSLGYGATGAADKIPANATLTFEIELLSIK